MDFAFFALGFGSDLLYGHLGFVCGLLQALVYEDVRGFFDRVVSEDLGYFLPAEFVPKSVRGKDYRFVFGVELKNSDLRNGGDVVAREIFQRSLILHLTRVVVGIIELFELQPEVTDCPRWLQSSLHVAGLVVLLLADNDVFLIGKQGL